MCDDPTHVFRCALPFLPQKRKPPTPHAPTPHSPGRGRPLLALHIGPAAAAFRLTVQYRRRPSLPATRRGSRTHVPHSNFLAPDPISPSDGGRAYVEREQGAAAVFDGRRAYRRGPKIPWRHWKERQVRKITHKVFDRLNEDTQRREKEAIQFEEVYIAVLCVYNDINKYLPGPHYDPPSKERLKALMNVRTCPPIGSADAVSEYGDPPQLARKRRLGSRRFEEGYQVSRCICRHRVRAPRLPQCNSANKESRMRADLHVWEEGSGFMLPPRKIDGASSVCLQWWQFPYMASISTRSASFPTNVITCISSMCSHLSMPQEDAVTTPLSRKAVLEFVRNLVKTPWKILLLRM